MRISHQSSTAMIVRGIFVKVQANNIHIVATSILDQGFLQFAYGDLLQQSWSLAPFWFWNQFSRMGIELRTNFGASATWHIARRNPGRWAAGIVGSGAPCGAWGVTTFNAGVAGPDLDFFFQGGKKTIWVITDERNILRRIKILSYRHTMLLLVLLGLDCLILNLDGSGWWQDPYFLARSKLKWEAKDFKVMLAYSLSLVVRSFGLSQSEADKRKLV